MNSKREEAIALGRLSNESMGLEEISVYIAGKNENTQKILRELGGIPNFEDRRELYGDENVLIKLQGNDVSVLVSSICQVLNIEGLSVSEKGILPAVGFPIPKEKLIQMVKQNGGGFATCATSL